MSRKSPTRTTARLPAPPDRASRHGSARTESPAPTMAVRRTLRQVRRHLIAPQRAETAWSVFAGYPGVSPCRKRTGRARRGAVCRRALPPPRRARTVVRFAPGAGFGRSVQSGCNAATDARRRWRVAVCGIPWPGRSADPRPGSRRSPPFESLQRHRSEAISRKVVQAPCDCAHALLTVFVGNRLHSGVASNALIATKIVSTRFALGGRLYVK